MRRIQLLFVIAATLFAALCVIAGGGRSAELALGDSLALGFGQASHMPTRAIVGISSCRILGMTPSGYYDFVLLSAGTNDPPGRCVAAIRESLHAGRVEWVVPVNGARANVLSVAAKHGDSLLYYAPGGGRVWPHPTRYFNVHGGSRHATHHHHQRRHHSRSHH